MERIKNAWELAKASWRVLSQDRELIAVPIVAGLVSLVMFLVIVVPGVMLTADSEAEATSNVLLWIFLFAGVVVATWISAIGQATIVAGAAQRMDGADPTVGSAFTTAAQRGFRLLQWAVMAAVVAVVLDQLEQRLGIFGRIISWLGTIAFRVMSFLALPVIMFEDVGAVEAFKRSSAMLKRTWGEQLTFSFSMSLIGYIALIPVGLVALALFATGVAPIQVLGGLIFVVCAALVMATVSALSAVFKTALYRHAKNLPVDPAFDAGALDRAFRRR